MEPKGKSEREPRRGDGERKGQIVEKSGLRKMPYKDTKKQKEAMRKIMRQRRADKRRLKQQLQQNHKKLEKLRKEFPSAYELIFGRKKKKG